MKMIVPYSLVVIVATSFWMGVVLTEETDANKNLKTNIRHARQISNADQMVQNILRWLQGVYSQQSRRIRQGTFKEYLPPANTQKPRPFGHPSGDGIDDEGNFVDGGYPPAGSITPQPPFPIYTTGKVTGYPSVTYPPAQETITPERPGFPTAPPPGYTIRTSTASEFPTQPPSYSSGPTTESTERSPQPPSVTEFSGYPTRPSTIPQEFPTQPSYQPPKVTGYPSGPSTIPEEISTQPPHVTVFPGYPSGPSTVPQEISTQPPYQPTKVTGYPTDKPEYQPSPEITTFVYTTFDAGAAPQQPGFPTRAPPSPRPEEPAYTTRPQPEITPGEGTTSRPIYTSPTTLPTIPEAPEEAVTTGAGPEEDLKHPPHIHAIDVQCAKDMMTIVIEFNRVFNGVIYSKGYYHMPECRYVNENSGRIKYTFTVNLNMCGTEFVNAFDSEGKSYLENVLVLQNEASIQEVWDTIRSVRCLWEGNLKEQLSASLMVGMLTQEIVTFSGDTAMAKLDILLGRGPLGQPANGLVKIGEPMTLIVSISGDPGFDVQVKDCRAIDSSGSNSLELTDDDGCILKPKLFGAFQKTRQTGDSGASIIAYAYFNAFKFPDIMDIMIECNIELCKTDCEMCPNTDQALEPARRRRRRDVSPYNVTLHDGVSMGKHIRVVLAEDLAHTAHYVDEGICMSTQNFLISSCLMISLLTVSCFISAYMWLKSQRMRFKY